MYRVTAVVWELIPEMQNPEFEVSEAPAMLVYVRPLEREEPSDFYDTSET